MRVLAIKVGFYNGERKRVGAVFEMPDAQVPGTKWVEPAPASQEAAAHRAQEVAKTEREAFSRGAVAASGTKGAMAKKAELDSLV